MHGMTWPDACSLVCCSGIFVGGWLVYYLKQCSLAEDARREERLYGPKK